MLRIRLAAPAVVAILAVACSSGAPSTPPPSAPANTTSATRIAIKLTDGLRMEPAGIPVPVGKAVTFVVTNAGANAHEFYVGDETAQAKHEMDMNAMGGMAHDEANGIALKPGETKELTMTFGAAGTTIAGCHQPAHYGAGMKASITIGG